MKIAIVGGGISGLTSYLNLQKHVENNQNLQNANISITIYETHDLQHLEVQNAEDIPSHGGGYGLAPNGMASLRRLNPEIHEEILRNGFPSANTTMKSARGWTLGVMPFWNTINGHIECCIMVLREVVLHALYKRVPASVVIQQKVVEVHDREDKARLKFDDGKEEDFDLVIGADGVWSRCRRALTGDTHPPEYRGLFTIGDFVSTEYFPPPPETGQAAHSQTVMTFGPNGFFAYTPYTTGTVEATEKHLRGEATLPPGKSGFWWSRSAQKDPQADPDEGVLRRDLEARHASWKDPTIQKILQNSGVKLKIPTYVLPKQPTWSGKRIVLVGDAAHALPSSSGQGVSQSLEDTEALSLLLAHNLETTNDREIKRDSLAMTFQQYTEVRKPHVEKVLDAGNRAGDTSRDMNAAAEFMMYGAMWIAFKLFGALFAKTIQNYSVIAEVDKVKRQH